MDLGDVLVALGAGTLFVLAIFFLAIIGALVGLAVGWLVSITPLGAFVVDGLNSFNFHVDGLLPQVGAALGFVSGFFTSSSWFKHTTEKS